MAHELPPLPYTHDALEPHIDKATMEIHHGKHHNAYITNLNKAIAGNAALEAKSAEALISDLASVPENIRGPVRNNAGGHVNHSAFWKLMAPKAGGTPSGKLQEPVVARGTRAGKPAPIRRRFHRPDEQTLPYRSHFAHALLSDRGRCQQRAVDGGDSEVVRQTPRSGAAFNNCGAAASGMRR